MIHFLGDVEFEEFGFNRFLLVDGIYVRVQVFKRPKILLFNLCLSYLYVLQEPGAFDQDEHV